MGAEEAETQSLIPGLPDDIALDCLARVPFRFHSALRSVSRRWRHLLYHPSFFDARAASAALESFVFLVQAAVLPSQPPPPPDGAEESQKEKPHPSPPACRLVAYNATAGTWHRLPDSPHLPTGVPMFCQCVAAAGRLVLIGGWDPATLDSVADVYVCDPRRRGGWHRGRPMSSARSFFSCAAVGGSVFVAGGHDNQKNALRSAEAYDVVADEWRELPPMADERDECLGVSPGDGRFWVVSGYGTDRQGRFDSSAECFNPATWAWVRAERVWPFPSASPRGSCGEVPRAQSFENNLSGKNPEFPSTWFLGTSSGGVASEIQGLGEYDGRDKSWTVVIPVPETVSSSCAAVIQGGSGPDQVFVMGSVGGGSGLNQFRAWVLDVGTRKWREVDTPLEYSGFVYSSASLCF